MNKEVKMHLHSTISAGNTEGDFEKQVVEQTLPASFYEKDNIKYIFYQEKDDESGSLTNCRLELAGKKLTIIRKGPSSSQMELDVGKTTQAPYRTPFGNLTFDVKTDSLQISHSDHVLLVQANYTLFTDDTPMSRHTLQIKISEQ